MVRALAVAPSIVGAAALSAAVLASADVPSADGRFTLRWSDNISVPTQPGYAEIVPQAPDQLLITSFQGTPFVGKSAIYTYSLLADCGDDCLQMLPGTQTINWPNAVTGLNSSVFGFPALVVGNGFLVPTHTTGGVVVLEASSKPEHLQQPVKITQDKKGWFYHLAEPRDMNGDGRLDFVTARCQYGTFPWSPTKRGELLWLEQPADSALSGEPWREHHLADGPDFLFCVRPGAGDLALAAPEFINERLVYYYMDGGVMKNRTLDDASGPGFGCSWADLNGDGRLELLATNHLNKGGSVTAYFFESEDVANSAVRKQVLASGFSAVTDKKGTASPGDAIAFKPSADYQGKPYIFVSGDNDNSVYLLVPGSSDADDWSYAVQEVDYLGADIGRPAIADTDHDGFMDVYVPAYDNKVVVHYEFAAASASEVFV